MSSSSQVPITPDILVHNEGTLFLFCPLTSQAKEWIDEHVQSDIQWFGNALVVEHRFAWDLAQGMKDAGLVLARNKFQRQRICGHTVTRKTTSAEQASENNGGGR